MNKFIRNDVVRNDAALIAESGRRNETELLTRANVVGIGIGEKIKEGIPLGRLCLKVYVEKKYPKKELSKKDIIPQNIPPVETDVEEIGKIKAFGFTPLEKAHSVENSFITMPAHTVSPVRDKSLNGVRKDISLTGFTGRYRPAQGGSSIGHYKITAGTLGCLVKDKNTGIIFILSNNHVLANSNEAKKGDIILQPGPYDGGKKNKDVIGHLERWIEIKFSGEDNFVDAAIAVPKDIKSVTPEIMEIGAPSGITKGKLKMLIQKSGRTTGHTVGKIKDISATIKVNYDNESALFRNQILTTNISQGGDSGSLVMDMKKKAVGLLFAGSELVTIVNPISEVLNQLDVELYTNL